MTDQRPTTRRRRSADERIADLEAKIEEQKKRLEQKTLRAAKKRELPASIKRIPTLAKRLRAFADLAEADGRADLSTSVSMFLAGLQRVYDEEHAKRSEPIVEPEIGTDNTASVPRSNEGPPATQALERRDSRPGNYGTATTRTVGELTPSPRRRETNQRPATEAERRFDERLRSIARPAPSEKAGENERGPSAWER